MIYKDVDWRALGCVYFNGNPTLPLEVEKPRFDFRDTRALLRYWRDVRSQDGQIIDKIVLNLGDLVIGLN